MIIALDMDGTLLNSKSQISNRNKQAIIRAQQIGCQVIIDTGRAYQDAYRQLQQVGLICPIVSLNGATITLEDHNTIGSFPLQKDMLLPILTWIRKQPDLYCEVYTADAVYAGVHNRKHFEAMVDPIVKHLFQQSMITYVEDIEAVWVNEDTILYKVLVFSINKNALEMASSKFKEVSGINVTSSHTNNIEINHEQATKGRALQIIASLQSIKMKNTIVMGDSWNDLPMFEVAGYRVAMGNAAPILKENSDYITATNDEDGVALVIEELLHTGSLSGRTHRKFDLHNMEKQIRLQ